MKNTYFVTGIGTDIGKTVISAVITEALKADYWKPIQAGELHHADVHKVENWLSNTTSHCHPGAFNLATPMSPHAAAKIDGVAITAQKIKRPNTKNNLVIEGAGGLMVPLNDTETVADLILPTDKVIIVSRHYLGSINHTLLTVESLKARELNIFGIIFIGNEHLSTETIIARMTDVTILGRMDEEPFIDPNVIKEYAEIFRKNLT